MDKEFEETRLLEQNLPSTSTQENGIRRRFTTYQKLQGTTDLGRRYEQIMCEFYAVHLAINDDVKDFEMTSNNLADGKFDDLGLKVTFKNGKSTEFLFQLKHKVNKSINVADFNSESKNNDFGVKKYFKSLKEMNLDEDAVCILYTNCSTKIKGKMPLIDEISFEQCHHIEFEDFLVNTKSDCDNAIFEIKSERLNKKFYLFTSQLNVEATEEQVNTKLKSLLKCDIHDAFTTYMRNWWSGKFILTKHDVIVKISELAFSPFLKTLSDNKWNEKTESLKQAVKNFPLTIIEECGEDIVEKIWKIQESWIDEEFSKTKNKYRLKEHQVHTTLWYLGKIPLVVKVDRSNEDIIKHVIHFLQKEPMNVILIGNSKIDFGQWKTLGSLWDIVETCEGTPYYSDIMRKFYISFQGRGSITLENLVKVGADITNLIGVRELLLMSQQEHLLVGNQKEELPELHIPRSISPVLVEIEDVLNSCCSLLDIMVIVNFDETFGKKLSRNVYVNSMELSQYIAREAGQESLNLILLSRKDKCTCLQFEQVYEISKKSNIYLFQPLDDEFCILLLKKGMDFRPEIKDKTKTIKESEILNVYDNSHVFCAPPGMGKSTLMRVLYNSCPFDSLAVHVGLINHNSFLSERPDLEAVVDRFLGMGETESDLFKQFKKHFWEKRKLYMFLDGLDEVNSEHVECILDYVKKLSLEGVNVWLSSRENLREIIHETLNVVPIEIKELDKEEQRDYIIDKLKKSYTSEEIAKITLAIFSSADLNNSRDLLGIPLQLHIITEMFLNDRQVKKEPLRPNPNV